MGRKSQVKQMKQPARSKQSPNLNGKQKELLILMDKLLCLATKVTQTNVAKELESIKEIFAVTDKIKKLEEDIDNKYTLEANQRCSNETLDRFTTWLNTTGATFKGSSITEFPGYDLGLRAEIDIPIASLIIAVPRKLMLTVDAAKNSALGPLIAKDRILQNMPNVALSIFLLLEKFKGDSFWKPYLDILPASYSTVLYFTLEDLEELRGSPTLNAALNQIKSISRQYAYFYKLISVLDDPACAILKTRFTLKEYCWAVSTIMTRQNTIPSEDRKMFINALIPLWDLCNHTNGNISTDYNPELDRSECLAMKDFTAGEQLFICYGARRNADLFIHNGFVYEDNQHDGYALNLGISQSDPLREKRLKLLNDLDIDASPVFILENGAQTIGGDLLAFLRIFNMNEEQLQHWLDSDKSNDLKCSDCALDTALEKKTWIFFQARINLLLAAYKTTIQEDENLLKGEGIGPNKKLAVRMRLTEKRILKYVSEFIETFIKQYD